MRFEEALKLLEENLIAKKGIECQLITEPYAGEVFADDLTDSLLLYLNRGKRGKKKGVESSYLATLKQSIKGFRFDELIYDVGSFHSFYL